MTVLIVFRFQYFQCSSNYSISFPGKSASSTCDGQKHCLIMDEVDGMAGNEDRGGMAELIQLIKGTKIPIITMCNDRQHPKVRSLANHTFDLRFQRPRLEQIKVRGWEGKDGGFVREGAGEEKVCRKIPFLVAELLEVAEMEGVEPEAGAPLVC